MSNDTVPANGEAMSSDEALSLVTMQAAQILRDKPALNIERIIIIPQGVYMARSIAGFSAAANTAGADPLLQAIQAYRDGAAAYTAAATDDDDANDELAERTYVPPLVSLEAWNEPALTQQSAVEALRFALTEAGHFGLSETVRPMLRAALGYFDGKTLSTQEDRA